MTTPSGDAPQQPGPYGQQQPPYQQPSAYGQQQPPYQQPGAYGQQPYPQQGAPYGQPGYGAPQYQGMQSPQIPTPSGFSMGSAVKRVFSNYANFNGRATRPEFWWFWLFYLIVYVALFILMMIGLASKSGPMFGLFLAVLIIFGLAVIIPSLAVAVRRLHDSGRSGLFILVTFIPFVGGIILIVLLAQASQPNHNQYGLASAPAGQSPVAY